jgi:hypothetical protein
MAESAPREWGLKPTYTLLDVESPPVRVTVGREAIIPLRIGVRKECKPIDLLKFTAKADVELRTGSLAYGFSCKVSIELSCRTRSFMQASVAISGALLPQDNLVGGRFSVNLAARLLEYK